MNHSTAARHGSEAGAYRSAAERRPPRSTALRLFTDWSFLVRAARRVLRLPTPLATEDRRILEQVIFRYYASRREIHSVLFAGCRWYTHHYQSAFFPRHDYWTIEPDEKARKFGGRQHVVAPLERLAEFFPEGYFDLIVCNEVYGHGLDSLEQCESAFAQCHSRLRQQGCLVLGWNDVPARTPVPLENVPSLKRFRRQAFPPLGTTRYLTDTSYNHVYDFYCK
jgi:hypothetical protein